MTWCFEWHAFSGEGLPEGLKKTWGEAWEKKSGGHIFQHPTLTNIWLHNVAIPRGERPVLLVATDGLRTVYAPFTIRECTAKQMWRRDLVAVGGNLVFDYQDPLSVGVPMTAGEWERFWDGLRENSRDVGIDFVQIEHLPEHTAGNIGATRSGGKLGRSLVTHAPFITLGKYRHYDQLLATLPKKHRSNLNRAERWFGSSNIKLVILSGEEVGRAVGVFEAMLSAYDRLHGENNSNHMFASQSNINFYKELIRVGLPQGWLHLSFLEAGGTPVSWHIGFLQNKRFYWYKPCYSAEARSASPGQLHIARLIAHGIDEGWETFDFTVGNEPYKYRWTSEATPIYRIQWHPPHLRGKLHCWVRKMRRRLQGHVREEFGYLPK